MEGRRNAQHRDQWQDRKVADIVALGYLRGGVTRTAGHARGTLPLSSVCNAVLWATFVDLVTTEGVENLVPPFSSLAGSMKGAVKRNISPPTGHPEKPIGTASPISV